MPSLKEDRGVDVEWLIELNAHYAQPEQAPSRPITHSYQKIGKGLGDLIIENREHLLQLFI